jgi:outer membrane protein assembly factor BamA
LVGIETEGLVIERLQWQGNRMMKKVDTLSLLTKKGEELSDSLLDLDKRRILRFYAESGFFGTEVNIKKEIKGEKAKITFLIREGRRIKYKWRGLPSNLPVRISPVVTSEADLEANRNRLLEYYANEGKPFTRISFANLFPQADTIFYDILISEGELVWIETLAFSGNLTKEPVLKKILSFSPTFLFSEKRIKERLKRLTRERDNPVEFIGMEIIPHRKGYLLYLKLKERVRQELGILLTYLPKEKEVAGYLSLTLPNLFYLRRKLQLQWEKEANFSSYLFTYTEPFFLFTRRATVSFAHKSYDTLHTRTEIKTAFEFLTLREFLTLTFHFGWERTRERGEKEVRFSHLGQELAWETREGIFPRKGQYLSIYSYFGDRRSNTLRGIKGGLKVEGDIRFDLRNLVPNLSFLAEGIFADTLLEKEKTYLGGRKRVRGFREEELPSSFVLLFREDLKFPLGNGFFFPFFDWGGRRRERDYEWVSSFGFGLELLVRNSYFELVYAVPNFSSFLSGRIHLLTKFGF